MREYESSLTKEFLKGLIPISNRPRNAEGLFECLNIYPEGEGFVSHKTIYSLNDVDVNWGSQATLIEHATTRDYTISIKDYVSDDDLSGAMVYIDGALVGTTDVDGLLTVEGIAIGGHAIKITLAGYLDSDADALLNDYFVVT